ncbi:hypothetical protein PENTCL1PPCAC_20348, partial [Pristionchus entomophagus]
MSYSTTKPTRPPFPLRTTFPSRIERIGYKLYYIRVGIAAMGTAYLPVFAIRCILRQFFFKYKQWMFEHPKKPSMSTKIWASVRYLLSLVPPRLKSCDSLLPRQSVPALEDTIQRYLASIQQLHSKEKMEEINRIAREFMDVEGRQLQRLTLLYSLLVDNYVTGFWENQATQAARAARIAYMETQSQLAIDQQTYTPLGAGLICSSHLDKLYAITREPGEKIDRLRKLGISRHVAVIYNGGIYKVFTVDEADRILTVDKLTDTFIELLGRPDTILTGAEGRVPALTTDNRTQWHHNRRRFFERIPKNSKALRDIESAIIVITLDNAEDWGYDPEKPEILSNFMKAQLTGNGANRWADKSLNYTVCKNGSFGGTTEHSIADGCEFGAIQESFSVMENKIL